MVIMRQLSMTQRAQVVRCLCEGNSIRTTVRITGIAKNTVSRLLCDIGCACADFHHRTVRGLHVHRVQANEIWSFVGSKKKNVTSEQEQFGWGDVWTWTAIDADTKLCVTFHVGERGEQSALAFMQDCASRIIGKPQITTDAHKPTELEMRHSPKTYIDCDMKTVSGVPDPAYVNASFVEPKNLTMKMSMRRFTRLTSGFSKKIGNHSLAVALYFAYYNFCRVHQTLRVTPAMEAGLTDHVWSIEELCSLIPKPESTMKKIDRHSAQSHYRIRTVCEF
jgi:IS1 family transposase